MNDYLWPSPRQEKKSWRYWSSHLAAIAFGLLLSWLLLEGLLRIAYPLLPLTIQSTLRHVHMTPFTDQQLLPPQIWQHDDNFQFISRANINNELQYPDPRVGFHTTTKNWLDPNSHVGFRVPAPDWEPRWPVDAVVVGDSFSFCYTEYADCWVQLLADWYGLSMVNLGQVATGSVSHLNVLRTFGLPYEPRLVIWQWYGNDFNDDYGFAVQRGEVAGEVFLPPEIAWAPEGRVARWLYDNSAVYRVVDTIARPPDVQTAVTMFADPYHIQTDRLDLAFGRRYTLDSTNMDDPKNQFGRQQTQAAILEAKQALAERDIRLVVVLVPAKEVVYASWTEPVLGVEQLTAISESSHLMLSFCQEQNLRCLDATPALQAFAEQEEQLYWPEDTHLNGLGNQRLTELIWAFLVDEELVKKP